MILRRNRDTDVESQVTELAPGAGTAAITYTDSSVAAEAAYTYLITVTNEYEGSERSSWFHIDTPAADLEGSPEK